MVQGQKTVKMMSPEATAFLYPHPVLGESPNHSQVNFAAPDLQQHPLYEQALLLQQEFVLQVYTSTTVVTENPCQHGHVRCLQCMLAARQIGRMLFTSPTK